VRFDPDNMMAIVAHDFLTQGKVLEMLDIQGLADRVVVGNDLKVNGMALRPVRDLCDVGGPAIAVGRVRMKIHKPNFMRAQGARLRNPVSAILRV
jgi:hypothetical protein